MSGCAAPAPTLTSWRDGPRRQAIIDFVSRVTGDGRDFVAPTSRIAVFDNDGTLWCEQPVYIQVAFAMDRVRAMAAQHPSWRTTQPFKAILEGDQATISAAGEKGLMETIAASHSGMTTDEFARTASDWLSSARHPKFNRPYDQLVYAPMVELLGYLRAHDFRTYIVSGGGVEFMRVFAERVYGVPPEQVIGSSGKTKYYNATGQPTLLKTPEIEFIDDGPGKPSGINRFIGRKPIFAFGNSDGDKQMLEWTAAGPGARFVGLVHHTDVQREYAYDRQSPVGKLDAALDEAVAKGWSVVDMQRDWKIVFAG